MTITFASDTFSGRTVSGGLGTSSDTINVWQTPFSNSKSVTSVGSGEANVYYDNSGGGSGTYGAMCGVGAVRDVNVSIRFSFLSLTGSTLFRLIGRAKDNFNYYAAEVFGSHLWFAKNVSGSITRTSVAAVTVTAGVYYRLRFQCTGSSFSITFWQDGTTEPAPQWTGTDTTFTTPGAYGLLALATGTAANTGVNFDSFLSQSASSQLADIYVSTTGSDSNTGAQSQPLATIQAGFNLAVPASTVHVLSGVSSSAGVVNYSSGTDANHRIVLKSETTHGASIISTSSAVLLDNKGAYVDILGFEVGGGSGTNIGIRVVQDGCTAQFNYVHDIQSPNATYSSGGAGIVGQGQFATNFLVNSNLIYNTGTIADIVSTLVQSIYLQANLGKATNNIIVGCFASGIAASHYSNNVTISNNLIADTTIGIINGAIDGGVVNDNSVIANNIIYYVGSVVNNLFQPGTYELIRETGSTGTHNRYLNNLYYGSLANVVFNLQNGLTATGTIHADPKFINYKDDGTGNYYTQGTSPCWGAGTSTGTPTSDYVGALRSARSSIDIGPYMQIISSLFPSTSRRTGSLPSTSRRTAIFPSTSRRQS